MTDRYDKQLQEEIEQADEAIRERMEVEGVCTRCNGHGKQYAWDYGYWGPVTVVLNCPTCEGTGRKGATEA